MEETHTGIGAVPTRKLRRAVVIALIGAIAAAFSVLAVLLAGAGNRAGWWDYRMALTILRWAAWCGLGSAVVSTIGGVLAMPGNPPRLVPLLAIAGVVAGSLVFAVPWSYQARGAPPIHDITTDTANPPRFVDVLPLRKNAPNRVDYEGAAVAAQQQKAYPDIASAKVPFAPAQAFERSLDIAKALGWEIVAAVPAEGRIEATDTTLFMGFKDDIVIRVRPDGAGSRVDVRSVSRVGRGDFGANAKRIHAFLKRLPSA
jgi:uncharacterized protein (DUF1499 family)